MRRLAQHAWPGNVRELRNSLERAAALSTSDTLEADQILGDGVQGSGIGDQSRAHGSLSPATNVRASSPSSPAPTLDELERRHILRVLEETGGNRERAAAVLGISSRTLYRKLREYGAGAGE